MMPFVGQLFLKHVVNTPNKKIIQYVEYHNIADEIHICENGHIAIPLYIRSDEPIEKITIMIGNVVRNYQTEFLNKLLKQETIVDGHYVYALPFKHFKNEFHITHSNIIIRIYKPLADASCFAEHHILDHDQAIYLNQPHTNVLYKFSSMNAKLNKYDRIRLNFDDYSRGLFFNKIKLENIKNISIQFNGQDFMDLQNLNLKMIAQQITDDCFYIALDGKPYDSDDWCMAFQHNKIDCAIVAMHLYEASECEIIAMEYAEIFYENIYINEVKPNEYRKIYIDKINGKIENFDPKLTNITSIVPLSSRPEHQEKYAKIIKYIKNFCDRLA